MKYAVLFASALLALGAQQPQDAKPGFYPSGWVNTAGYELDNLRGKVVILFFFEEG